MPARTLLQLGDPKLKAKNSVVTNVKSPRIKKVIKALVNAMRSNDLVGIAAPQIGEHYQIFVTEPRETKIRTADQADELRVYINPHIMYVSEEKTTIYEGCGSVAKGDVFGPVKRPKLVTIEAYNTEMQKFHLQCDGLLARIIQHEYDHLSGIEFIEKVSDYSKLKNKKFYIKEIKNSPQQVKASLITVKQYSEI